MKFLEWFIKHETQKRWAELGGYTCDAAAPRSRRVPQRHAVQRGLLRDHVQGRDFWALPEYAELLDRGRRELLPLRGRTARALPRKRSTSSRRLGRDPQDRRLRGRVTGRDMSPGRLFASPGYFKIGGLRLDNNDDDARSEVARRDARMERHHHPESLHHSDGGVPHHLQRFPAALFAGLLVHRLQGVAARSPSTSSASRTTSTFLPIR